MDRYVRYFDSMLEKGEVVTVTSASSPFSAIYNSVHKRTALITGITGQDGSYLAEWLLHNNYEVHGIVRRASTNNLSRINHILNKITLHEGDITDFGFILNVLSNIYPDEIYNLAAQSHVKTSFGNPNYTFNVNALGLLNILEGLNEDQVSME